MEADPGATAPGGANNQDIDAAFDDILGEEGRLQEEGAREGRLHGNEAGFRDAHGYGCGRRVAWSPC